MITATKIRRVFHISKFFLNFFHLLAADLHRLAEFYLYAVFLSFPVVFRVWWCVPLVCWSWLCVLMTICLHHTHAHTYTRTHIRTRTGIFRPKFLDNTVIFRRTGIFIFFLPIGIFRCTRNFQTAKT